MPVSRCFCPTFSLHFQNWPECRHGSGPEANHELKCIIRQSFKQCFIIKSRVKQERHAGLFHCFTVLKQLCHIIDIYVEYISQICGQIIALLKNILDRDHTYCIFQHISFPCFTYWGNMYRHVCIMQKKLFHTFFLWSNSFKCPFFTKKITVI